MTANADTNTVADTVTDADALTDRGLRFAC
jgi:hypothetical protein